MGHKQIGWLVSPFLNGFYYGYLATQDPRWVERLRDWADAWIERGVTEPDGFTGWPKSGTGGAVAENFLADSLLGEAMGLRPLASQYGEQRLEAAATRAVRCKLFRLDNVRSILKTRLDEQPLPMLVATAAEPVAHDNIRGADYYSAAPGEQDDAVEVAG